MNDKLKSLAMKVFLVVLFLALGPGLFFYGAHTLIAGPGSEVRCGSEVMHDGQVCRETSHGSTVGRSYTEQRDEQNSFMNRFGYPVIALIVGSVVLVSAGLILWAAAQKRRGHPGSPAG